MDIDLKKLYTAQEAVPLLHVTLDTVKEYCRSKKVRAKKVGARQKWMIPGEEIQKLRKKWNLDEAESGR